MSWAVPFALVVLFVGIAIAIVGTTKDSEKVRVNMTFFCSQFNEFYQCKIYHFIQGLV